jgi:hypothetical protein
VRNGMERKRRVRAYSAPLIPGILLTDHEHMKSIEQALETIFHILNSAYSPQPTPHLNHSPPMPLQHFFHPTYKLLANLPLSFETPKNPLAGEFSGDSATSVLTFNSASPPQGDQTANATSSRLLNRDFVGPTKSAFVDVYKYVSPLRIPLLPPTHNTSPLLLQKKKKIRVKQRT